MELLEIEEIRRRLDEEFLPLEPMLTEMRLVPATGVEAALRQAESELAVTFPDSLVELTTGFAFGGFTLGPIVFGTGGDYFTWLRTVNASDRPPELVWWDGAERPESCVLIADSDPFAIVLETGSGAVYAFEHGAPARMAMFKVADRFDLFLQGLGTVLLERTPKKANEALARCAAEGVGVEAGNRFWAWLAGP